MRRMDVLGAIDAAFNLDDTSDVEWVRGIAVALGPLFADCAGSYAWLNRVTNGAPDQLDSMLYVDAPPRFLENIECLHREGTAADYAIAYPPGALGLHSLATLFGKRRFFSSSLLKHWIHDRGMGDPGALHVRLGPRKLLVGGFLRGPARFPERARRLGPRLGSMMTHAYRLRETLAKSELRPTAILTPSARVVHAGSNSGRAVRDRLRRAVVARERARSGLRHRQPEVALGLFEGLIDGRYTILDRFDSDGRRYLVAYENAPEIAALRALGDREAQILRRAVRGEAVKRIAIDLGITPSAAAAYLVSARRKTGLESRHELVRWFRRLDENR